MGSNTLRPSTQLLSMTHQRPGSFPSRKLNQPGAGPDERGRLRRRWLPRPGLAGPHIAEPPSPMPPSLNPFHILAGHWDRGCTELTEHRGSLGTEGMGRPVVHSFSPHLGEDATEFLPRLPGAGVSDRAFVSLRSARGMTSPSRIAALQRQEAPVPVSRPMTRRPLLPAEPVVQLPTQRHEFRIVFSRGCHNGRLRH
jgi:hypothetical protein